MEKSKLIITQVEEKQLNNQTISNKKNSRHEIQATMERLWLQNPQQFEPERDCIEKQRLNKTFEAIEKIQGKRIADLGCGSGTLSRMLRDAGAQVDAVDIAGNALQCLKKHDMTGIRIFQDCLPKTTLEDDAYDVVVCTEVIAHLPPETYRLCFAELSRIVKTDGIIVCSTALDLDSEDALERFEALAKTEFDIDHWIFSHHRLMIKLCHFFEAPKWFIDISQHQELRQQLIKAKKNCFSRWWLKGNTSHFGAAAWKYVSFITTPFSHWLKHNAIFMKYLERMSHFVWNHQGISHALFIGKRRPLNL